MRLAKRRRVHPSDPMAVVTRFLDAANRHDTEALYASVHPEFESFQPLHPIRNFRGPGQLISNWKAIFKSEPGFRLTVLRASTTGNTVWVELHGAGESAEAAGIFILGVDNQRIRWVRVYSDLVEPAPEEEVADEPEAAAPETTAPETTDPETAPEPLVAVAALTDETWAARQGEAGAADTATTAEPDGGAAPWLIEVADEQGSVADDADMPPPEPGLRLVAPAPLPTGADAAPEAASEGGAEPETQVDDEAPHVVADQDPEPEPEPEPDPEPDPEPAKREESDHSGGSGEPTWVRLRKALKKL